MRQLLASVVLAGLGLALPLGALAQVLPMPVIPPVKAAHPDRHAVPVWEHDGNTVSVTAAGKSGPAVPTGTAAALDGHTRSTRAGVKLTTKPGITAHASVNEIRWTSVVPACAPGTAGCLGIVPAEGIQSGELGAGYTGHGVKLDLSIGQSQADAGTLNASSRALPLPRVLPANGGADVAAPLWFRNSTSTSLNARGQVNLAPNTSVDLGASVGHIRFLPGMGLVGDDALNQTTLSLGIQHGDVRGAIVGHMLEPDMPGAALAQTQSWSGIDLGVSVRLPWRGELNFGAQNVWSSGRSPLLFGPGTTPDQGRVPYVQYHQDL
ncbi:MAG: hypothetical protein ACREP0_01690 [Rhodanobacteraceae bacterium]